MVIKKRDNVFKGTNNILLKDVYKYTNEYTTKISIKSPYTDFL